ncbi:MAG: M81 family metallopeptidase [Candidatus Bathyarchaeota archaeon]
MRIAVVNYSHETCTFCPEISTLELWEKGGIKYGEETLDTEGEGKGYLTGYKEVAEAAEDVELVGIIRTSWPATTGYGSWNTTESFDVISGRIMDRLKGAGKLDGVLLALHGAMAVTGVPRPEAELARRVRKVVGKIPIMVTLDLHANEDIELANAVDGVFILKTYPHLDTHDVGVTAARCMVETIRGNFKPAMAHRRPGVVCASVFQASGYHPMKTVYDRCREWEEKGAYCASVAPGYAYADVPDVGVSVFVVTDGDRALAEEAAQDLSDLVWSLREALTRSLPKAAEGVAEVIGMVERGEMPVVIAYHDDRLGDGTHILKELIEQGAKNWCSTGIADPKVLEELKENHKVGDTVTVTIGGWLHQISGNPVTVTGVIEHLGPAEWVETGPMRRGAQQEIDLIASLDIGENRHIVVTEKLYAPMSADPLKTIGIDVDSLEIVEIKSRVHHKAYWDTWSTVDYPIDPPGLGPADLSTLDYENLPWGIYPIGEKWER